MFVFVLESARSDRSYLCRTGLFFLLRLDYYRHEVKMEQPANAGLFALPQTDAKLKSKHMVSHRVKKKKRVLSDGL